MAVPRTTRRRQRLRMASEASTRYPPDSQRGRARTEKSCGPDARGSGAKPCGDVAANRRAHQHSRKTTGAIVQRSPRRARRTPLKPFAQEGRATGNTCGPPRVHFYRARISGASRRPAFPAPSSFSTVQQEQNSGDMRREKASACLLFEMRAVERWPATRSSLRAQPSNPESFRVGMLDCLAALAMTVLIELAPRHWCPA
jgi:hypothetical protein